MEYMPGGELHSRLQSEGKMKENDAKIIFAQLLSAVMHLVGFCRNLHVITYLDSAICAQSTIFATHICILGYVSFIETVSRN